MAVRVLRAEWMRIKWWNMMILLLIAPVFGILQGGFAALRLIQLQKTDAGHAWDFFYSLIANTYAMWFFPLLGCVVVAMLCRYEHQDGTWKQLLTMPVPRWQLYFGKMVTALLLVAFMQLLLIGGVVLFGKVQQVSGSIPWSLMIKSAGQGWMAMLPLIALQLWVSYQWKNFAAPLSINVICTIPAPIVAQSKELGPWYLWSQPLLAMLPREQGWFETSSQTLVVAIGGSFLLFCCLGLWWFVKRDWYS